MNESTGSEIDWKSKYQALVAQIEAWDGQGVYPMGHLTEDQRERAFKDTDAYKCGWNDAVMDRSKSVWSLVETAEKGLSDHLQFMLAADVGGLNDDGTLYLNMNDTWGWALAWCPRVSHEQLPEVVNLFREYGRAGLLYWHSEQENGMRSEFHDINRMVDFVRREQQLRKDVPNSSKRAYTKLIYTLSPNGCHDGAERLTL